MAQQSIVDQDLLIIEASRSYSDTPDSVRTPEQVISPTQRPVLGDTQLLQETDVHAPAGFEPTISVSERLQIALDSGATGIGNDVKYRKEMHLLFCSLTQNFNTCIKSPNSGRDPEPVPFTSHPHRLFP